MENLKIKATDEDSAIESRVLFRILGFSPDNSEYEQYVNWVAVFEDGSGSFFEVDTNLEDCREVTLQELRDMVVLKRNDVGDATHSVDGLNGSAINLSGKWYAFNFNIREWGLWTDCFEYRLDDLKPIKREAMKEYLFKYNNQYTLVELSKEDAGSNPEQYIEIPDGAEILTVIWGDEVFYKSGKPWKWYSQESKKWMDCSDVVELDGFQNVLWQRKKESLNDKIAIAEVARQEEKHSHYKKDVSHLNVIDPYRIADLYNLHPCAEHIMKKSLCAGNRGHKDTLRDIQDIIDTAERWKQMIEEDNNEI